MAYCRLPKRKEKTKNRLPNFSFPISKAKRKNHRSNDLAKHIQSVQRSHTTIFLRRMKHYLAASDEIARRGSLHEFVSTVLCMILWVRQSLEFTLQFSLSHLIECPSRVFVWMLESINIMEQIEEDNYLLTVQWRFVEGLR